MIGRYFGCGWSGSYLLISLMVLVACAACTPGGADGARFVVTLADEANGNPVEGRLYVLLAPGTEAEPMFSSPVQQRVLAIDVTSWKPGEQRFIDHDASGYPTSLADLPPGEYTVRAVIDRDTTDWRTGWAPGNLYSSKTVVEIDPATPSTIELTVEHSVEAPEFVPTDRIHEIRLESQRLAAFAGLPQHLEAAVILPEAYADSGASYPTVYVLPGWGATHHAALQGGFQQHRYGMEGYGRDKVFVFLNHDMPLGAHCFANSDVVGPWGDALVEELIPRLEESYRLIPAAEARFLAGQSSGAWGALWLQLTFPEHFAGAWAASPDYVDFRAFGPSLDLYDRRHTYFENADGSPRPGVRDPRSGRVVMTVREAVARMAVVLGADQMTSFEAVFGEPVADGTPRPLFDRATGEIDPETVRLWSRFDLRKLLFELSDTELSHIAERIHIRVGASDDYYLNEAVERLWADLEARGVDADIEILDGLGHDVWSDDLRREMHASIDNTLSRAGY